MKALSIVIALTVFAPALSFAEDDASTSLQAFATVAQAENPIRFSSPTNGSFGIVFKAGRPDTTCSYFVSTDGSVAAIESGDSSNPVAGFAGRTRSGCGFNSTVQVPTIDVACTSSSLVNYVVTPVPADGVTGAQFSLNGVTVDDADLGASVADNGALGFYEVCDGADQTIRIGMRLNILDSFGGLDTELNVGQMLITANFD
jgi:hypothetical protein